MPSTTLLEIPPAEQVQMRAILRRTRYGYLLAFHILLLCAAGHTPTEIATFLLWARSSVSRIGRAYRAGSLGIQLDEAGQLSIAIESTILMPWLTRARRPPQKGPPGLGLVPHPVELCHARPDPPGHTWQRGVGSNGTPLAPRDRRGLDTRQTHGHR